MKLVLYVIGLISVPVLIFFTCSKQIDFPELKGPYLGQEPPDSKPKIFMPGMISTYDMEGCIAFLDEAKVCVFFSAGTGLLYTYEKNGKWTIPEKAPFQNEGGFTDFTAGPDEKTLLIQSSRPTSPGDTLRDSNIWTVELTGSEWTEPKLLSKPPNSDVYHEGFPSMSYDKSVYFFTSSRPDSRMGEMYQSRFMGDKYREVETLEDPLNSRYHEVDPFVAPDGSYVLFGSNRPGGFTFSDLYVSFRREDGSWTHSFNAGETVNSIIVPIRMSVTPDGKYFFFVSNIPTHIPKGEEINSQKVQRYGDYDIYWLTTDFIHNLKKQYFKTKCAFEFFDSEYRKNGLESAQAKLESLYKNELNSYHFELSEFLTLCGGMIESGNTIEAEQIYNALRKIIPQEFRLKLGFAQANICHGKIKKGLLLLKEIWEEKPSVKLERAFGILSYYLQATSQKDAELELLRFIVREFPNSYNAHFNLARAYSRFRETEQAIKHCKESLELKPGFSDALELLDRLEKER